MEEVDSDVSVEMKQQKQKLTKEEFNKITVDIRSIVGNKLKNHRDGDSEPLLKEF